MPSRKGQAYAKTEAQPTSLKTFHSLLPQWTANGALEVEMLAESEDHLAYNVTRCRYSEMYREMGLEEIGHVLSCGRDGTFCTGYNPSIKLERTQNPHARAIPTAIFGIDSNRTENTADKSNA